jgi:hypothetical protein
MLRRKLYIKKRTADQARTATDCVLGSAMRGTLSAREIVAKDRIPSEFGQQIVPGSLNDKSLLTNCSNNLRLETELILETSGKVADTTLSIARHIWHLSDVVEHVSACEEQNRDQADCSPQVSVLDEREDVGCGDAKERDKAKDSCGDGYDADIVKWPNNRGLLSFREVPADPGVDAICSLLPM